MIDIHNHLLYGIDDGSRTIEESIDVLKDMEKCGYTDIILTPHYIDGSRYSSTKKDNQKMLEELQKELNKNNISINLYLGNEIYIDDDINEFLDKNYVSSLNDTKYLLIELPMSGEYTGYQEVFNDLIKRGYKVILAHPERYLTFQDDYDLIYELKDMGVLFQCNIDSLVGKYGPFAKDMIIQLLIEGQVSFLATDIHHKKHDPNSWEIAKKIALKYISLEDYKVLTEINPSRLIG